MAANTNLPNLAATPPAPEGTSRRSFLRTSAAVASGLAAMAASLAPLRELTDFGSVEEFLQKHYKELTPVEMEQALARIRREVEKQYDLRPHVRWTAWSLSIA
jgi:molybdopterin-containing oxidoreductase family iron-sulfur binding subunit